MTNLLHSGKATILVVDDTPENLTLMASLLKDNYQVRVANHGDRALKIALSDQPPDLILLDIMMPDIDGYEVCRRLKADVATRDIPIIFLTARSDIEDEQKGLNLGAVDYITKPINPPIVLARVAAQLSLKARTDFLREKNDFLREKNDYLKEKNDFLHNKNDFLEHEVARRTEEVTAIQDVTILVMASLAETRDAETGNHIRRTQNYVKALAEKLKPHPRFAAFLTDHNIRMLFKSAPLHDIGKVGIPDRILLKPGRFTPEEFEIMKTHTTLGRDAIAHAEASLGTRVEFLTMAKDIALFHQEKWDGSGYPAGLQGDAIPISARLMAVADVYDALISRRVYKDGMPHERAVEIIEQGRGKHFDPDLVDCFLAIQGEFQAIALRYADSDKDMQKKSLYVDIATPDTAA
jgi:putative two-component system response regulator